MPTAGGVASTLTDGTGVSKLTSSKVLKDIVLDFLLALPPALLATSITNLEAAMAAPIAVAMASADTVIRVIYRAALRWAQS